MRMCSCTELTEMQFGLKSERLEMFFFIPQPFIHLLNHNGRITHHHIYYTNSLENRHASTRVLRAAGTTSGELVFESHRSEHPLVDSPGKGSHGSSPHQPGHKSR